MENKLSMLINEFEKKFNEIPSSGDILKPTHVRILADLASVITAAQSLGKLSGDMADNKRLRYDLEENIVDELCSAEYKYLEYIKNQDPALLNIAKDELRHAGYYLSQAKMSTDNGLLQRLRDYNNWYTQIEGNIAKIGV